MNKMSEQTKMLFSNYSLHITKDESIDRKLALSVLLIRLMEPFFLTFPF